MSLECSEKCNHGIYLEYSNIAKCFSINDFVKGIRSTFIVFDFQYDVQNHSLVYWLLSSTRQNDLKLGSVSEYRCNAICQFAG